MKAVVFLLPFLLTQLASANDECKNMFAPSATTPPARIEFARRSPVAIANELNFRWGIAIIDRGVSRDAARVDLGVEVDKAFILSVKRSGLVMTKSTYQIAVLTKDQTLRVFEVTRRRTFMGVRHDVQEMAQIPLEEGEEVLALHGTGNQLLAPASFNGRGFQSAEASTIVLATSRGLRIYIYEIQKIREVTSPGRALNLGVDEIADVAAQEYSYSTGASVDSGFVIAVMGRTRIAVVSIGRQWEGHGQPSIYHVNRYPQQRSFEITPFRIHGEISIRYEPSTMGFEMILNYRSDATLLGNIPFGI